MVSPLLVLSLLWALIVTPGIQRVAGKPLHDDPATYHGHQVIRAHAHSPEDVDFLRDLSKRNLQLEFWTQPTQDKPVDILVSPKHRNMLHLLLKTNDIDYHVSIPNVQKVINQQLSENGRVLAESADYPGSSQEVEEAEKEEGFSFHRYHTLDEIMVWLQETAEANSNLMSLVRLGESYEGRPIYAVKLSASSEGSKPAIWLDAGIHSNEWIGPATMLYFIDQLIRSYRVSPEMTWILDNLDWYILPLFNVDGYVYTWTKDRLWRKNRSVHKNTSSCVGVDLNRNWGFHWGEGEPDIDPCGRLYIGPHAESEPEVRAVVDFLSRHNSSIKAYLAYHSFSQLWMLPFSFSEKVNPRNLDELYNMSQVAVSALERVHGTKYYIGRISDLVGEAAGASVDYTYSVLNIKYSFGIELRDTGRHGTLLPPNQIVPNAEESLAAVRELAILLIDKLYEEQLEQEAQKATNQQSERRTTNQEAGMAANEEAGTE